MLNAQCKSVVSVQLVRLWKMYNAGSHRSVDYRLSHDIPSSHSVVLTFRDGYNDTKYSFHIYFENATQFLYPIDAKGNNFLNISLF